MASPAPSTAPPSVRLSPPPAVLSSTPAATTAPPAPLSGMLRLAGTSRLPSVRTLDWVARGFTKVAGEVEIATGNVTGSLAVGGRLIARRLDLSGSHRIEGEVQVSDQLRTRGTFRAGAGVSTRTARFTGTTEIGGSLTVRETLQWKGSLDVGQDVRAGTVLFQGRLAIHGTLAARSVSGEVDRRSSVEAIEANWVEIRRRKPLLPPLFVLPPPTWQELEVERIEAQEAHLAGVRVRHLKADRIWLGPHTHVEYVEGTIVERHKEAHVGPESESPPPPGLSR